MIEHLIDTGTCVIAFATERNVFITGIEHHEFGRTLQRLGLAHVLVRDDGHWYHRGIEGCEGLEDSIERLRPLRQRYRRLLMVGVSYGAHGALLYGPRLCADEVIAISPVDDVAAFQRHFGHDKRPDYRIDPPIPVKVRAFIGTGHHTDLDLPTCERLGLDDVTVFIGASHADVAKRMRDTGWFDRLLS